MSEKFEKLNTVLKELFQLDQPDLDFGFYRVMHAKSAEVTQFLEKDLLPGMHERHIVFQEEDRHSHVGSILREVASTSIDPGPNGAPYKPANSQLGGRAEVVFDKGAPAGTRYKQDKIPPGT